MTQRKISLTRAAKMKIVYLSGPYTPINTRHIQSTKEQNVETARGVALSLWSHGLAVICPQLNTLDFEFAEIPYHRFIEGDIALINMCDAIVLLPNWEHSRGAKEEAMFAMRQQKDIYYWPVVEGLWAPKRIRKSK